MGTDSPKPPSSSSSSGRHRLALKHSSEELIATTKRELLESGELTEDDPKVREETPTATNKLLWLVLGRLCYSTKRQESAIAWAKVLTVACLGLLIAVGVLGFRLELESKRNHERGEALLAEIKAAHAELKATRDLMAQNREQVAKIDQAVKADAARQQLSPRLEIKSTRRPGRAVVRIVPPVKADPSAPPPVEIPINLERARQVD